MVLCLNIIEYLLLLKGQPNFNIKKDIQATLAFLASPSDYAHRSRSITYRPPHCPWGWEKPRQTRPIGQGQKRLAQTKFLSLTKCPRRPWCWESPLPHWKQIKGFGAVWICALSSLHANRPGCSCPISLSGCMLLSSPSRDGKNHRPCHTKRMLELSINFRVEL